MNKFIILLSLIMLAGCEKKKLTDSEIESKIPAMQQARMDINNENWKSAETNLKEVIILQPEFSRAHLDLAIIYHQHIINYIHAIYHYDKYLELNPLSKNNYFINEQRNNLISLMENKIISNYKNKIDKMIEPKTKLNVFKEEKKLSYITYTVKKGDTLSNIANKFYNNPNEYTKIYNANSFLKSPADIRIGQKIIIPE